MARIVIARWRGTQLYNRNANEELDTVHTGSRIQLPYFLAKTQWSTAERLLYRA